METLMDLLVREFKLKTFSVTGMLTSVGQITEEFLLQTSAAPGQMKIRDCNL